MSFLISPLVTEASHTIHDSEWLDETKEVFCMMTTNGDTIDVLKVMLHAEQTLYSKPTRYFICIEGEDRDLPAGRWRLLICDWFFRVVDLYLFDRDVVSIALDYFDRCASSWKEELPDKRLSKYDFKLLAVSSLYLAIKLHGAAVTEAGIRMKHRIEVFSQLSQGLLPVEKIAETERKILSILDWHVNPPIPGQYVGYLVRLLPQWSIDGAPLVQDAVEDLEYTSKYFIELACVNLSLPFDYDPSIVAFAALNCACETLYSRTPLPNGIYGAFLNITSSINPCWTPLHRDVIMIQRQIRMLIPSMFRNPNTQLPSIVGMPFVQSSPSAGTVKVEQDDDDDDDDDELKRNRVRSPKDIRDASYTLSPKRKRPRTQPSQRPMNQD